MCVNSYGLTSEQGDDFKVAITVRLKGLTVSHLNSFILKTPGDFDFEKLEDAIQLLGQGFTPITLIDIGANIGVIGIEAIKRSVFEKVIAFEPVPNNYRLLVANVYINGLEGQIKPYNLALGSKLDEVLTFELSNENFGDHRVKVSSDDGVFGEKNRATIEVISSTLDSKVGAINPHETLIWMDVQGYEAFVCTGAKQIMSERPPCVMEFWPYGIKRAQAYQTLKDSISMYEFFYDLRKKNPQKSKLSTLDNLYAELGEDGDFTDILII